MFVSLEVREESAEVTQEIVIDVGRSGTKLGEFSKNLDDFLGSESLVVIGIIVDKFSDERIVELIAKSDLFRRNGIQDTHVSLVVSESDELLQALYILVFMGDQELRREAEDEGEGVEDVSGVGVRKLLV